MKKISLLMVLLMLLFVTGCKEQLSQAQLREMQTKVIKTDLKTAFLAARSVFIDRGYTVKESELESGFIQAETGEKPQTGCLGLPMSDMSEQYSLNCNVESYSSNSVKMRINLQQNTTQTNTSGGYYGLFSSTYQTKDSNVITDPKIYEALFDEIQTEITRRKAAR